MFTGIIQAIGQIISLKPCTATNTDINTEQNNTSQNTGLNICIKIIDDINFLHNIHIGDSICIQGACMTVTSFTQNTFNFDISAYSVGLIADMLLNSYVNLEKAAQAHTFLGGHIVTGHIDATAKIHELYKLNESYVLTIVINNAQHNNIGQYIAAKGSLTINGASLTTNLVEDKQDYTYVTCNLIPHTMQQTTFKYLAVSTSVNIEIDVLARYLQRMLNFNKE